MTKKPSVKEIDNALKILNQGFANKKVSFTSSSSIKKTTGRFINIRQAPNDKFTMFTITIKIKNRKLEITGAYPPILGMKRLTDLTIGGLPIKKAVDFVLS